jgi:spoIIIJ-associated protein
VAHAEASARTVEAAITAAAAQFGLRSDQVDVEVLEEPVPSTFGYIGSPARVRVTPRESASSGEASGDARDAAAGSPADEPEVAVTGRPSEATRITTTGQPSDASGGIAEVRPTDTPVVAAAGRPSDAPEASGGLSVVGIDGAGSVGQEMNGPSPTSGSHTPDTSEAVITSISASGEAPDRGAPDAARDPAPSGSSSAEARDNFGPTATQSPLPTAPSSSAAGLDASEHTSGAALSGDADATRSEAGGESFDQSPTSAQSSSLSAAGGDRDPGLEGSAAVSTAAAASATEKTPQESAASERSHASRPRRTHRDEPVDPEMIEADTERAGDFLEGLLDALDVDGDITTWIDEAGGHIELEGTDLNVLVGSNGETLDALQELTRIAVLRQSKRRVRLLLDINGFRSRQRDELVSVVKATAERVIRSREDHEFEPMTPAERKIVHDAVAAIDGVQTESLGEEPYRRVVIRPT